MSAREASELLGESSSGQSAWGSMSRRWAEQKRKKSDPYGVKKKGGAQLPDLFPDVGRPRRKKGCCAKLLQGVCLLLIAGLGFALFKKREDGRVDIPPPPRPGPAPRPPLPPSPQSPVHVPVHRHIGLLPKPPARHITKDWWGTESLSYCMYSEPRFNDNCMKSITWAERKDSLVRCLQELRLWFEHFDLEYFMAFSTLLAIERHDETIAWANPCEVAVPRKVYEKIVAMITTGWRADASKGYRYTAEVLEDNPWDKRTDMFPAFRGEWWAPLDKVFTAPLDQAHNITDVGLLYKPQESCAALRVVDKRTGFYCEVLTVDEDEKKQFWQLQWPGGPRSCKTSNARAKRCSADACYMLPAAEMMPAKACSLAGVPLMCPKAPADMLSAFYLQLRYRADEGQPGSEAERSYSLKMKGAKKSYSLEMKKEEHDTYS